MQNGLFEQILPFLKYLRIRWKKMREVGSYIGDRPPQAGPIFDSILAYSYAGQDDLEEAIIAEQNRGIALDEKTFRHAAATATALTVASAATTAVAQLLTSASWKIAVVLCTAPAVCYVMIGGLLGYGAARTLYTFGTGIRFKLEQNSTIPMMKTYVLAEALACQEAMNSIRGARNEAAFLSMRNGFLFVAMAVLVVLLGVSFTKKDDHIEPKIWPAASHSV